MMFPTNRMGKATDTKPKDMKCKLDTVTGVNIMPLATYKYINPSEFDEQGKPIDDHRPANYTQTTTGQGYVNPRHSNNKVSVSFSEGLSSAISLQNRQLMSIFPATKLPANSEAVQASLQTRQVHNRNDAQAR